MGRADWTGERYFFLLNVMFLIFFIGSFLCLLQQVVSLLDLTRKEIIAAVYEFRKLIGQGVYCVFYFCGHGFEVSGQLYLVPCDAPQGYSNIHCVSSDKIKNILLAKEPQLFCMILDVCRKP